MNGWTADVRGELAAPPVTKNGVQKEKCAETEELSCHAYREDNSDTKCMFCPKDCGNNIIELDQVLLDFIIISDLPRTSLVVAKRY